MRDRSSYARLLARQMLGISGGVMLLTLTREVAGAPDAPSVELSWSGPGTEAVCLGGARLTAAVNDYLGRVAISEPPGELRVHVEVERRANDWRARIELVDLRTNSALGEREIVADGALCSGLDDPLKLSVALLVDSDLSQSLAEPTRSEPRPKEPEPEPPEPPPPPPEEPPPLFEPQRWVFTGEASALALGELMPGTALGGELGFAASPSHWLALRLHGAWFLPQTREVVAGASYKAGALYGGFALCPRAEIAAGWSALGCFGIEAGRVWVDREGFEGGRNAARRFLAGSLGVRLLRDLGSRLALAAQLSALLPVRQDRFLAEIDGKQQELFGISAANWVAGLGLVAEL